MILRSARSLKALLVVAVVAVPLLAYVDVRRAQAHSLDDFMSAQETLARAAAYGIETRARSALRALATTLDGGSERERLAARLVRDDAMYREIDLVDEAGHVAVAARATDPPLDGNPRLREARDAALRAVHGGSSFVSPPIIDAGERRPPRLRYVAIGEPDGRAIVALVDGMRLLDVGLDASHWIVRDRDARWTAWSDTPQGARAPDVDKLLAAMDAQEAGSAFLDRGAAESLGLGARSAVAGFATVEVGGHRWTVALLTSASRLRDRARLATGRIVTATALVALLSGLFFFVVQHEQRRAQALAEQLRLAAATAALRERSEQILEAIPLGVLALDGALRVRSANAWLLERGARVPPEGTTLAGALPEATPEELAVLEDLVADAHACRRVRQRSDVQLRVAGALREIDAGAIPLARPLPDTDCFLVLHDRTETRSLERSLVRAEKLATIGTLTAGVAHELGTPLGIISGRAEQLLGRVPDCDGGDGQRKALTSILAQVEKVSTTIRQLLDFSRVRPIEGTQVTPTRLLEGAAALLEHRFRQAKVRLHVDAPPTVPAVSGDPGQLEQLLVNLLMNAVDACAAGGAVEASASARDGAVELAVRDDGCGIPREQLGLVLDPFFTTKKRGQGTGLGLTIAADIVKNHGGRLDIESEPGRGTTVRVTLPVEPRRPQA